MAWDFSTEPEFQEQLDWMRAVRARGDLAARDDRRRARPEQLDRIYAPLQEEVKRRGLWAAHLSPDLGGQGFGQVKLGLMHEILGHVAVRAATRSATRRPTRATARSSRSPGTDEQKERWLHPLLAGDLKSAFSMTEPEIAGSDPTTLQTTRRARRRRVGHQRPQVVLVERVDRRLPHRHGGHRPRRAPAPARLDVHRPGRHAGREHRARHRRRWSTRSGVVRQARQPRRDPLRGRARPGRRRCSATRAPASSSPSTASGPGRIHHCMRWLGVSRRAFDMLCERATYREAQRRACWPRSRRCRTGSPTRPRRCRRRG